LMGHPYAPRNACLIESQDLPGVQFPELSDLVSKQGIPGLLHAQEELRFHTGLCCSLSLESAELRQRPLRFCLSTFLSRDRKVQTPEGRTSGPEAIADWLGQSAIRASPVSSLI